MIIKRTIYLISIMAAFSLACGEREERKRKIMDDEPTTYEAENEDDFSINGDWQVINSRCIRILSFYNNQYFNETKRCGNKIQRSFGLFAAIDDGMLVMSYTDSSCEHLKGAELYATYKINNDMLVIFEGNKSIVLKKITSPYGANVLQDDMPTRAKKDCSSKTIPLPPYNPQPQSQSNTTCIDVNGNKNTTIIGNGNTVSNSFFLDKSPNTNTNTNTNINNNTNNCK